MKKILSIILINILLVSGTFANIEITNVKIKETNIERPKLSEQIVTREEMFQYYSKYFRTVIPESYKYIDVKYTDVDKNSRLHNNLQMLIYYNLLENRVGKIYPEKNISALGFYTLSEKVLGFEVLSENDKEKLGRKLTTKRDFVITDNLFSRELRSNNNLSDEEKLLEEKQKVFDDVYKTLSTVHYKKDDYSKIQLLDNAIIGLTNGTGDKHTSYFPPTESESFLGQLDGDYEGIGAYVDMPEPGTFMIISPINDGPAFKAGLKGGDQIMKVDEKEITIENSTNEIISWIKGEKGTAVNLEIKRGDEIININVVRDRIVLQNVETELINSRTFLITINTFGENVSKQFTKALEELKTNNRVKKVIIDVRNNGGGYLDQVTEMLSHIIPEGEQTALVKSLNGNSSIVSDGYNTINLDDYTVVLLQNSGSASASEIFVGTVKDYFPEAIILGEKSFGKGSVQRTKQYSDSSLLKYTIAGWYTGGTETSIDGIGIMPDEVLEFDSEKYQNYEIDNQLEKAIKIN